MCESTRSESSAKRSNSLKVFNVTFLFNKNENDADCGASQNSETFEMGFIFLVGEEICKAVLTWAGTPNSSLGV